MQHDLKTKEIHHVKNGELRLYYWCICGEFYGGSEILHYAPICADFLEHLTFLEHPTTTSTAQPRVNERGEWAR